MNTALKLQNVPEWLINTTKQEQKIEVSLPKAAHERVSSIYNFLDTELIIAYTIEAAKNRGFNLTVKKIVKVRSKTGLGKHFVIFGTGLFIGEGHTKSELTLTVQNSADGLSAARFILGMIVALCSNGLFACIPAVQPERVLHKGMTYQNVEQAVNKMFDRLEALQNFAERLQSIQLNNEQIQAFTKQALEIRGLKDVSPEYTTIDKARRIEDQNNTAWSVFNRVQENLTKGFRVIQGGKIKQVQALRSPASDFKMNVQLMDAVYKLIA